MKAIAFSNNDMAIAAWTFGGKIPNCLGFAIYRTDVNAGVETCLPALATFAGQNATPGRTTLDDPVQKFFWKDVYAKRGGSYRYRIVPLGGAPGNLSPLPIGSLTTNTVQLTANHGILSVYFNRGILATQATAKALHSAGELAEMKAEALKRIADATDPLRISLAGDMTGALMQLPKEAAESGGGLYCALYEFEDQQLIDALETVGKRATVILSNMPGTVDGEKTDDTYAPERKAAGKIVNIIDRMMPSGHIGHNKFTILVAGNGSPKAVQFGSTNWTSRALCGQSNNSIIARSPAMAAAFKHYWDRLKADTDASNGEGKQLAALRQADKAGVPGIQLEDNSATVDLWFSPNTDHARAPKAKRPDPEPAPPDLSEVFDLIAAAKQAILFVEFEPGSPSVIDAIAAAQKANPALFVRGTVTVAAAADEFAVGIKSDAAGSGGANGADGQNIPEDYRVIPATGVNDAVGVWEKELNSIGFAVTHSKYVVIDPFSDGCVVVTGSHNDGYQASYNNDENLAIIKGHRPLAEAYAANALDIYDHYAWRWWLSQKGDAAWTSLKSDDSWQDSYFDKDNRPISPELNFWLAASPSANSLPAASNADLNRPALDLTGKAKPSAKSPPKRVKRVSHATGRPVGGEAVG